MARSRLDPGPRRFQRRSDPFGCDRPVVLAREVDLVAEERLQFDQCFPQFGDPLRQSTVEAVECRPGLRRSHRVDQVPHRLGLNQVELSVEHRAAGELSRRRVPGSRGVERRKKPRRGDQPSMAGQLDHVLAGVAVGSGEDDIESAVDRFAAGMERGQRDDPRSVGAEALYHPGRDLECPSPLTRTTASAERPGGVASAAMGRRAWELPA